MDDADRGPWDDVPRGLGLVLDEDRGSLPYQLIHGESLVACAAWALGDAGVDLVDASVPWSGIVDAGRDLVLHDSLCPMTPAGFIAACLERARETGAVVVGVDDAGRALSPVVVPAAVVAGWSALPSTDVDELVRGLDAASGVERRVAPAAAARVSSREDVAALERLTAPEPGHGPA